jgi:uncharacterized protein YcfL
MKKIILWAILTTLLLLLAGCSSNSQPMSEATHELTVVPPILVPIPTQIPASDITLEPVFVSVEPLVAPTPTHD